MPRRMRIGGRDVGEQSPALVVAEAGVNHDGSVEKAHALVEAAAAAGADAVKFQTFDAASLATASAGLAEYQTIGVGEGTQLTMLRRLQLPVDSWPELREHASQRGLLFLSTPFDEASVDLLVLLGVPAIKIASTDATNLRLIRHAAGTRLPVLCSTGASDLEEVAVIANAVLEAGSPLALLHCVSSYPAPDDQLNLFAITTLASRFDCVVGYSDHSAGILAPVASVILGAKIVEKHLTMDRSERGPDHAASVEPPAFREMVRQIRLVEQMLGTGAKVAQPSELETARSGRRSLVWARNLPAGAQVSSADLVLKRPGSGLPPGAEGDVVGRRLRRPARSDALVSLDDLD